MKIYIIFYNDGSGITTIEAWRDQTTAENKVKELNETSEYPDAYYLISTNLN